MKVRHNNLLIAIIMTFATTASAKIWTVDNNTINSADFTTLQAAHDGAMSGDTIYVSGGSGASYGNLTMTKTLNIYGPGNFLSENPNTQASLLPAIVGTITMNTGSSGSLLTGLNTNNVIINVENILFRRNFMSFSNTNVITLNDASNVIITQNYIVHTGGAGWGIKGTAANAIIRNNYIKGASNAINISSSSFISRNVFEKNVTVNNSDFRNNTMTGGTFSQTNSSVFNNIGNSTQFGTSNGNQESVSMSTVFVGIGSTDGQWQLAIGSPAIGAASDGGDIGMFGGSGPYILSGIPSIPSIYFFDAPTSGSANIGLPVSIKVKSNN